MRRLPVLVFLVFTGGCASVGYTLSGTPIGQQQVAMDRGVVAITSDWKMGTVSVQAASAEFHDRAGFWINVANHSDQSGNFGTENLAVSNDGHTWLSVETYEQVRARLDNNTAWAKFGAALVSGLDMGLASQAGRTEARSTFVSPYGSATVSTTIINRDEQYAAMQAAQERARGLANAIDARHDAQVSQLEAVALRTTTVYPAQSFGGLVVADVPNMQRDGATPLYLRVSFLGENHVFYFQAHKPGAFFPADIDRTVAAEESQNSVKAAMAYLPPRSPSVAPAAPAADVSEPAPAFQRYDAWEKQHGKRTQDN